MGRHPSLPAVCLIALAAPTLSACGGDAGDAAAAEVAGLGEPTATLAEDFGLIQTVRERPDGTVLVADPLGRALYLVDMDAGTRTVVGSEGEGPGEYLQPDAVWPLPGDSTLLVDLGNARLVALGPDFGFGPTMPLAVGDPSAGGLVLAIPQGVDRLGRIYVGDRGGGFSAEAPEAGAILRIDRGTQQIDTVGSYELQDQIRTPIEGGRGVSITQIPLSAEDAWGVRADGAVAVARAAEYRLDWLEPDGTETLGSPVPLEPLSIGSAEQDEWFADQERSAGLRVSVTVGGGSTETYFERGGGGRRAEPDPSRYEWPDVLPAVYPGRIPIDAIGRAWVRRHVGAGGPPTYDVFDGRGERVATVELFPDRAIVGFGRSSVYVVRYDEFDLNYLERYEMPAL